MSSPFAADVIIPVFNEGPNIRSVLESLKVIDRPIRVLICYDFDEDSTLAALKRLRSPSAAAAVRAQRRSRSARRGPHRICQL